MFFLGAMTAYSFEWNWYAYLVVSVFSAILVIFLAPLAATNKPEEVNMYYAGIFFASASLIMGKVKISVKGASCIIQI